MKMKPYSSAVLAFCGVALIGVGSYFIFLRPALLPEDVRFIGAPLPQLQATAPNLLQWLNRIFWVMGGYIDNWTANFLCGALLFSAASKWRVGSCCLCGLSLNRLDDRREFYDPV